MYYGLKNSTHVAWDHGAAMPNPNRPGLALLQILLRCQRGIHGLTHCIKHPFASFVKKKSCSERVKLVSERTSEANFFRQTRWRPVSARIFGWIPIGRGA
jgi:hypothetical protein